MHLKETELCLGLPGGGCEPETLKVTGKRVYSETVDLMLNLQQNDQSSSSTDLNDNKLQNSAKNNKDVIKPPAKYDFFTYTLYIHTHIYKMANDLNTQVECNCGLYRGRFMCTYIFLWTAYGSTHRSTQDTFC